MNVNNNAAFGPIVVRVFGSNFEVKDIMTSAGLTETFCDTAWHTFAIAFKSNGVYIQFDKGSPTQLEPLTPYTVTAVKLYLGVVSPGPRDVFADDILVAP